MGEQTTISWTDHTFNPWWGCTNVSPGCDHCYAETFAHRLGKDLWGKESPRRFFGPKHWAEPIKWNRAAEGEGRRHRVFCASMADVFENRGDLDAERIRLWTLIDETPWLDWQLLTKRPEHVQRLAPWGDDWPANVWLGTTVEDQRRANLRVPRLIDVPAAVRFLSCEPLLGPVVLRPEWIELELQSFGGGGATCFPRVDWVIVGGESGPHHRPLDLDDARHLRDQCATADVAFLFKQVGGRTPTAGGRLLDGEAWHQFPRVGS